MQRRKWMPKKKQLDNLTSELLIMKGDLRNVFYKLDDLFQKMINLNHKVNQHIKEGSIPREIESNIGTHIISTSSDNSGGGTTGDR